MTHFRFKHLFLALGIAMSAQVLSANPQPTIQQKIEDPGTGGSGGSDQQACVERCHQIYLACMAVAQTNDDAADCSINFTICVNSNC